MDDFNTFKISREKIDPASRKMSDSQWQQAYDAYCSARERAQTGKKKKSGASSRRRKSSSRRGSSSSSSSTSSSSVVQSSVVHLRNEVRRSSAYSDLRMMIDFLAWIAIGVLVLTAAVKLVYYNSALDALVALLSAVFQVIAVIAMRLLIHVIIDIPDIALFKGFARGKSEKHRESGESHSD